MLHRSVSVDIAFVHSFCFHLLCFFFFIFFPRSFLFRTKIELQITRVKLELVDKVNSFFGL